MISIQDKILQSLKNQISTEEWENYIKKLKFNDKASKPDYIIYIASNLYIAKFINTKYSKKIADIYEVETGVKPVVIISDGKEKNLKKDQNKSINKFKSTILSGSFSFENFIVGDSNRFAYTCAKAVAENPGERYNPLFIYGNSGLGKTHLLQSIGNYCIKDGKFVICVTSEQFANELKFHIETNSTDKFKEKYRTCDLLLIDDIQLLSTRKAAIDELFHTFNELKNKNCQIVITNDKPPQLLKDFESRLVSRFESGLVANINPPDLNTKIGILTKKAGLNGLTLNKDVIEYIAANLGDNVREMEGILTQIRAYQSLINTEISLDFVKANLKDSFYKNNSENVGFEEILQMICSEFNVKPSEIRGKNRTKNVVKARRVAIYICKNLTQNTMPKIALFFGLKDHSAVSHNIRKLKELMTDDNYLKLKVEELENKIKAKK